MEHETYGHRRSKQCNYEHPTDGRWSDDDDLKRNDGRTTGDGSEDEPSVDAIHNNENRWRNSTKTVVVLSPPNTKLADIDVIHKNARDNTEYTTRETGQNMMNQDRRRQRRRVEKQRLKPWKHTNSKRTIKKTNAEEIHREQNKSKTEEHHNRNRTNA